MKKWIILFLLLPTLAYAGSTVSIVANPIQDVSYSGNWNYTTNMYTYVDDYPDGATGPVDYLQLDDATGGNVNFGPIDFGVPRNSTIESVELTYYVRKMDTGAGNSGGRLRIGETYYNADLRTPSSSVYTLVTDTWTTNPATSSAWTVDQLNYVGDNRLNGFGLISTDADPAIRYASIQIKVNYVVLDLLHGGNIVGGIIK